MASKPARRTLNPSNSSEFVSFASFEGIEPPPDESTGANSAATSEAPSSETGSTSIFARLFSRATPIPTPTPALKKDGSLPARKASPSRFSAAPNKSSPLASGPTEPVSSASVDTTTSVASASPPRTSQAINMVRGRESRTRTTVNEGSLQSHLSASTSPTSSTGSFFPQSMVRTRAGDSSRRGDGLRPLTGGRGESASSSDLLSRRYWMSDESARECYDCKQPFSAFLRKHHCRICGLIFCHKCASNFIPGQPFGFEGDVRVCNFCVRRIATPSSSSAAGTAAQGTSSGSPIQTPRPLSVTDSSFALGPQMLEAAVSAITIPFRGAGRSIMGATTPAHTDIATTPTDASPFASMIAKPVVDGVGRMLGVVKFAQPPSGRSSPVHRPNQEESSSLAIEPSETPDPTLGGSDLLQFRGPGVSGDLSVVSDPADLSRVSSPLFEGERPGEASEEDDDEWNYWGSGTRMHRASSTISVQGTGLGYAPASPPRGVGHDRTATVDDARAQFMRQRQRSRRIFSTRSNRSSFLGSGGSWNIVLAAPEPHKPLLGDRTSWLVRESSTSPAREPRLAYSGFLDPEGQAMSYLRKMIRHILIESQVDSQLQWENIILSHMIQVARNTDIDVKGGDDPDIREYVKVKRIPGGVPSDSEYISGIVISKGVAHKSMVRRVLHPRILLVDFPLEYERVENQFVSLDRVLAQEREHLGNLIARISSTGPDVVIVTRSVSRLAAEFLQEAGLIVASNVRPEVVTAIARFTRADIVHSIDRLALNPRLGTCEAFDVRLYLDGSKERGRKSFLFFEGCPAQLGSTIVLRGGNLEQLTKIKQAVTLTTLAVNSMKLEAALFVDQFASVVFNEANAVDSDLVEELGPPKEANIDDVVALARYFQYKDAVLSSSPHVSIAPPFAVERAYMDACSRISWAVDSKRLSLVFPRGSFGDLAIDGDILSPFGHQSITLLSYLLCSGNPIPCRPPDVAEVDFYGALDATLGQLVQFMCSQAPLNCSAKGCDKPYLLHKWIYVHLRGQVEVSVEKLACPVKGLENSMLMWSRCKLCDKETPVVAMGEDTWKLSASKYLELVFYMDNTACRAEICPHDVQKDHIRCVAYRNFVCKFEFSKIVLFNLTPPPLQVNFSDEIKARLKSQDLASLRGLVIKFYDSMVDRLKGAAVTEAIVGTGRVQACKDEIAEIQRKVVVEKNQVLDALQQAYSSSGAGDMLALNDVYKTFTARHREWEADFANFGRKYFQPDLRRATTTQIRRVFGDDKEQVSPALGPSPSPAVRTGSLSSTVEGMMPGLGTSPEKEGVSPSEWAGAVSSSEREVGDNESLGPGFGLGPTMEQEDASFRNFGQPSRGLMPRLGSVDDLASGLGEESPSLASDSFASTPLFNEGSLVGNGESLRRGSVERLPPLGSFSGVVVGEEVERLPPASQERNTLMRTVTALWSGSPVNWAPLDSVIQPTEHILPDSTVIVREDEPSSLIAYSLSTKDYSTKLDQIKKTVAAENSGMDVEGQPLTTMGNSSEPAEDSPTATVSPAEEMLLRAAGHNMRIETNDGPTVMSCKLFYVEQFDALREACGVDVQSFVASLARCVKWDATGGKSGSTFLKTRDERFIMKELPKPEMDAFLQFAPQYFRYVSQSLFHSLPTAVAKIFGLYRIKLKNSAGKIFKLDIAVMENLWYNRKISRIFDLKGSLRNRMANSTGQENEVLLDENLIEMMFAQPFFLRQGDKSLLRASLQNDTLFLSKANIMDYSLIVGVDLNNSELVVGIVDFIRTFTWDKKLESWVKETGILGGGSLPTIVGPRVYRSRFREAMERYFLMVPDMWTRIGESGKRRGLLS